MNAARKLMHRINRLVPPREDGVVVLTYHLVGARTGTPVDIPPHMFELHLAQLEPLVVSLDGALEHLSSGAEGTKVVLTFDDAFQNFYSVIWPLLVAFHLPAVLYVPTDFVDRRSPAPLRGGEGLPPCTWEQIREMVETGSLTVGSHSRSHGDMSRMSPTEIQRELIDSRYRLEDELCGPVTSFCFPGGRASPRSLAAVRQTYSTAVVRGGRKLHAGNWSPWRLERVPIREDSPCNTSAIITPSLWIEELLASKLGRLRDRVIRRTPPF